MVCAEQCKKNMRKHLSTAGVAERWHKLLGAVEPLRLGMFRSCLDTLWQLGDLVEAKGWAL